MRIGLPDTMRFERYGPFWAAFLGAMGLEVVRPARPLADSLGAGRKLMGAEPPTVQLFVGRVLELAGSVDALIVPDLNPGADPAEIGAADPWAIDLAAVLARRLSLPPLHAVPARLDAAATPGVAVRLGQALTRNGAVVRRALDRTGAALRPGREAEPAWSAPGLRTVGLAGDPVLLEQPFLWSGLGAALGAAGLHPVPSTDLPPERALEAGRRARPDLGLETDLEAAGGAALLMGKAAVRGLVLLSQPGAESGRALAAGLARRARKPSLVLEVGPEGGLSSEATAALEGWAAGL